MDDTNILIDDNLFLCIELSHPSMVIRQLIIELFHHYLKLSSMAILHQLLVLTQFMGYCLDSITPT